MTREELEALPVGAVVLDVDGDAWELDADGFMCLRGSDSACRAWLLEKLWGPLRLQSVPE